MPKQGVSNHHQAHQQYENPATPDRVGVPESSRGVEGQFSGSVQLQEQAVSRTYSFPFRKFYELDQILIRNPVAASKR